MDAGIAAAVLATGVSAATLLVPGPSDARQAVMVTTAALAAVGVLFRRRFPAPLLALATLDAVVGSSLPSAMPFAAYAWTRYGPAGWLRWAALLVVASLTLEPWDFTSGNQILNHVLIVIGVVVMPAVLGLWVRTRAELIAALRERAERAEAEQQLRAREAVLAERARITREMHDVVGHRVSLMVLQAGAVDMAADDPDRVRLLAGQLQDAGRRSLEELRQLLGLLQEDPDEDAPLAPQPGLGDVEELVGDSRQAGLEVTLTRCGTPRELDPTVGRTAYRVVQEALTNAGKHAPGGAVAVTLDLRETELAVAVVNRRATRPPAALPSGGLGLIGLRERVRTVGGTLRAEPRLDGGFCVEAVLPC
jgi:signal transduction histidine kinase